MGVIRAICAPNPHFLEETQVCEPDLELEPRRPISVLELVLMQYEQESVAEGIRVRQVKAVRRIGIKVDRTLVIAGQVNVSSGIDCDAGARVGSGSAESIGPAEVPG